MIFRGPITRESGTPLQTDEPMIKSDGLISRMWTASQIAAEVLEITAGAIGVGVTTDELDQGLPRGDHHPLVLTRARSTTTGSRNRSAPSRNEVICHGIPGLAPIIKW